MNTQKILKALRDHFGSYAAVAVQVKTTKACVTNWSSRGIPPSRLPALFKLARQHNINLDVTDFWPEIGNTQQDTK